MPRPPRWLRRMPRPPRWLRRSVRAGLAAALTLTLLAAVPFVWTRVQAAGHLHTPADLASPGGPRADVVIVLGAQVAPGRTRPYTYLQARLDTAAAILASGQARVVLVTGDRDGGSGDET